MSRGRAPGASCFSGSPARRLRVPASGADQIGAQPLAVLQQHLQQVLRRQPLVPAPQRHRLRRLQKALRAIGVLLEFHPRPRIVLRLPRHPFGRRGNQSLLSFYGAPAGPPVLDGYRNMIYHPGDSRRLPSGTFGLLAFRPGSHSAFEDHLAPVCLDGDPAGIDLGLRRKASSILRLISAGSALGFSWIVLITPLTPLTRRTALSASSR